MAVDGSFYLDSGQAKLFFSRDDDKFIFHRMIGNDSRLGLLFLAMPKLPLVRQPGQKWSDYLPMSLILTEPRRLLYQFFSSFVPRLGSARYIGQWQCDGNIMGAITVPQVAKKIFTSVTFDNHHQLIRVTVGDSALERIW
jgi:hypothetical protein